MSLEMIIFIVGQIATWVTVILVFLTLREMEKQRKASQKPDVVIPKVILYGYTTQKDDDLIVPTEWSNKEIKNGETQLNHFPTATVYNLGFGAAKNIILKWDFDISKIMQTIKDYCYQNSIPIVVSVEDDLLKINIKGGGKWVPIKVFSNQDHDYLLPASLTSKGLETPLPLTFLELLSVVIYMFIHDAKNSKPASKIGPSYEIPSMRLYLKYEAISGLQYTKNFKVDFSIVMLQFLPDKNGNIVQGTLDFNSKA